MRKTSTPFPQQVFSLQAAEKTGKNARNSGVCGPYCGARDLLAVPCKGKAAAFVCDLLLTSASTVF